MRKHIIRRQFMTKTNTPAMALVGLLFCACCSTVLFADPPSPSKWEPIPELTDEFEGDKLDSKKWHDRNPDWKGRFPGFFSRNNVSVSDGKLHLTARVENLPNLPKGYHTFTTAAVKSKTRALYGYFEIKCKPMNSRASSAFWFYAGDQAKGKTTWWTEIDVFEICGRCPKRDRVYHMNVHVFVTPEDGKKHWCRNGRWKAPFRFADGFHVYALEWDTKVIRWYVDGKMVREAKNTHWHQPLHMNFDSETMPKWFGLPKKENLPSTFSIEYVRSWKKMPGAAQMSRWSKEKANKWYDNQSWLVGCNFIPSTAINQLEMWQADTFDAETIARELKWASDIGFNTVRVYLHDLAWEADASGFKKRIGRFLDIAEHHNIKPMFVLFNDCWNANPKIGKQPAPKPGVHNSGWLQSPGKAVVNDPKSWPRLERYVKDIIGTFAEDERVLAWDLYNEPGNRGQGSKSLPLLRTAFEWARAASPAQPLTTGVWRGSMELTKFQLAASDVVTFHNYGSAKSLSDQIAGLKKHGRPIICTEWLRRGHSNVASHLPIFRKERVGCYNWGLVAGKTQTIYPWGSREGASVPKRWFHDLLRKDGAPFDPEEAALFKKLTGRKQADGLRTKE